MVFQQQAPISQKLATVAELVERLPERLRRAYTLIGEGRTLTEQFLDAASGGIMVFDARHRLIYTNPAAQKILGEWVPDSTVQTAATLQNHCRFYRVGTSEAYPLADHPMTKVIQGEAAYLSDIALKVTGPSGDRDIPLEIWIDPTIEDRSQRRYTLVVCLDISERNHAELLLAQQLKIEADFKSAQRVLEALLPNETPDIPGFELVARCLPASAVGGDFYDWYLNADGNLVLTVGDVMGQQLSAALLMTTLRAALRAVGACAAAESIQRAASALAADFERLGSFASLFQAQLYLAENRLVYASTGHTGGAVLRSDGSITELGAGNPPLGVQIATAYQAYQVELQPGDRLVLYTRGLVHSHPAQHFDGADLPQILSGCATAEAIIERLFQLGGEQSPYDRTVLVLSCQP
jgi:hypothetical protein